jgi:tetratricopeptide (TPR) repeat protein
LRHVIAAQESAGDRAIEHHLYEEGARYYQDALKLQAIGKADRARISEKLGKAYFFSGNPTDAAPWFDRALVSHLASSKRAEKSVELLLQTITQLWVNAKTQEALPLIARAIKIVEYAGSPALWKAVHVKMASHLCSLDRFSEAAKYLDRAGPITDDIANGTQSNYYIKRASVAAAFGQKSKFTNIPNERSIMQKKTPISIA